MSYTYDFLKLCSEFNLLQFQDPRIATLKEEELITDSIGDIPEVDENGTIIFRSSGYMPYGGIGLFCDQYENVIVIGNTVFYFKSFLVQMGTKQTKMVQFLF